MKYKMLKDTVVARIDRGEDILEQLTLLAEKEQIKFAEVSALGAVNELTVGVYDTAKKQYFPNSFTGSFEIVSLTGTVTTKDAKPYLHLHMSVGNDKGEVFGGHLNKARVSATCEVVIRLIDSTVSRFFDEEIGLNLLDID